MGMLRFFCIGLGVLLAGQAWAGDCKLAEYGSLPVEMVGSKATTMAKINGTDTRFILDTGAFYSTMSSANASALGLKLQPLPFGFRIIGVGGASDDLHEAHVKEFGFLDTTLKNVDFIVGGTDAGEGLLGANLLDLSDLEIDLAHGKMALFKADHCDKASLAYWVKDGNYNVADIEPVSDHDRRTFISVTINGHKVRALLDTGASATGITREAAQRIGIDLKAPDVKAGHGIKGIGGKRVRTWIVNIDSFSVGSETIQHSQMEVIGGGMGDRTDMLLGVDFILAHHMFIANSTKKAYFTYNGGRVFTFAKAQDDDKPDTGSPAEDGGTASKTAGDYALSGQAHLSRGELKAAIADLDEAIRMAPDQPAYYVARARADGQNKQPDAALADLDKSLSLDPKNLDALLMRAELRILRRDHTGAVSDVAAAGALAPAGSTQAYSIASLYVKIGQPSAALPILDEWIRLHDGDAMLAAALNERCALRGMTNQMLDDALEDCREAIERDGKNPAIFESLGLVELRLGHYPESIKAYTQAVEKMPRSAWSRYGLGLAEIRSGQTDAGHADLVAAHAIDPHVEALGAKYGLTVSGP
jgi:clan AA aspartic protease (TIGR02281 family)